MQSVKHRLNKTEPSNIIYFLYVVEGGNYTEIIGVGEIDDKVVSVKKGEISPFWIDEKTLRDYYKAEIPSRFQQLTFKK